jgi:DNA repair exonuclease SbcCD nuclease subunit
VRGETKVAIITDQHFGARNDSSHFLEYYEKFYRDTFFPILDKNGIDTVLILGDTFDRRKYINFFTLKRAREMFFDKLYAKGIKVYMLAGNHDTYFKNTNNVNSVQLLLQEYNNINVIDSSVDIRTVNATANWTINVRGSVSTTLDSIMSTGEQISVVFESPQGATAYYPTAFNVDGSAVVPKWLGGSAPASGNINSNDVYVYTIRKTGAATFTALASQSKFA